ncbi:MAG: RagB/SusD family nutrient uptake outer membrane protein [Tannerellaceae bacterium]|jgi:tetratricopeptide (TPR) repeat protein|nr:RagB/SusD family nutrient uptake outer membrane protein [Tannerellaceae bacterium]
MKRIIYIYIAILTTAVLWDSCSDDYLQTSPTNALGEGLVKSSVSNLDIALNGAYRLLYKRIDQQSEGGEGQMGIRRDLLGEDVLNTSSGNAWYQDEQKWVAHRDPDAPRRTSSYPFRFYYPIILEANLLLQDIDNAEGTDENLRTSLKGESLTIRAWGHFQLVQLYGKRYQHGIDNSQPGVPYQLTPGAEPLPRETVENVYKQANTDIDNAIELLKTVPARTITHFSLKSAYAVKARIALAQQNYAVAAEYADLAIAQSVKDGAALQSGNQLLSGFSSIADNSEWIWASQQNSDQGTSFASFFAYMSWNYNSTAIRINPKAINSALYDKIKDTDVRKNWWDPTGTLLGPTSAYSHPKYQGRKFGLANPATSNGDVCYIRLAELYLMKAEALARTGNTDGAKEALTTLLVTRDPEYTVTASTADELIEEILIQRRIELWGEGFRFTDLKRLDLPLDRNAVPNATVDLCKEMFIPAGDPRWQWVIPIEEMNANPLMVQNP